MEGESWTRDSNAYYSRGVVKMIIKANQEDTNEILKYAAQSLLKGREELSIKYRESGWNYKADCRKRSILFNH